MTALAVINEKAWGIGHLPTYMNKAAAALSVWAYIYDFGQKRC